MFASAASAAVHPAGRGAALWDALVAVATTAAVAVVPIVVFPGFEFTEAEGFEWLLTAVFGTDAGVQARRLRRAAPSRRRGAAVGVALDVLAAVPTFALGLAPPFLLLRLLKLHRVAGLMRAYTRRHAGQASRLRLIYFAYWLAVVVHLVACGFVQLGGVAADGSDAARYLDALYWCVSTLTTVGFGDIVPRTPVQKLYAIGVMFLGVGVYAFLIGNIASLLTTLDPLRAAHDQQRERVGAFMRYRGLPAGLRQRVQAYLDFVWDEGLAVDEEATLSTLPPGLREELALHLRRDLVRGVPLFAGASEAFVRDIALQMQSFVALPGDVLVRAGDHGHEMYFIGRGRVEVLSPAGAVYRTLGAGDFFGEIALVDDTARTATVRALAPSDLYVLDRALFERVAAGYPDVAATLREAATHRQHGDA